MIVSVPTDEAPVVEVRDRLIEGWLVEPGCPRCGGPRVFFLAFEATCCPACNEWLDLLCPDPDCVHCLCRPARPWPEESGPSLPVAQRARAEAGAPGRTPDRSGPYGRAGVPPGR